MTSLHISTSATGRGASERPNAISVEAFRALSPAAKAARAAALDAWEKRQAAVEG